MSNSFWSPALSGLKPYVPGEQPRSQTLIKLNTNENPYPPSPRALALLSNSDFADALRRYPDPESSALRATIAAYHQLDSDQVFVGNGSDEVLAHSFYSFFRRDEKLLFPDITYSFYPVYCQYYGIDYHTPALREDFSIDIEDYSGQAGGVIFANPNAPSGRLLELPTIVRLLQAQSQRVVVIDEAYVDFGGQSAVELIEHHPNLLVTRTLSKSHALAGLRLGYALGQAHLIEGLNRAKNSFNSYPVDSIAQRVAAAALEDIDWLEETREKIVATREKTTEALKSLAFDVVPSTANFVFARPDRVDSAQCYKRLRAENILVRHFAKPRIRDYLRISIGTDSQMDALCSACENILREP